MRWTARRVLRTLAQRHRGGSDLASIAVGANRDVQIGRVFSRAFGTIGANPGTTFGLCLLFGVAPGVIADFALRGPGFSQSVDAYLAQMLVSLALVLFKAAFHAVTQGAMVGVTVAYSEDRAPAFLASLQATLRKIVPLFLLGLLILTAEITALLLLILPGILLYIAWSVVGAAMVAEDLTWVAALSRSIALTRGAGWKILAVQLLAVAIAAALQAVGVIARSSLYGGTQGLAVAERQWLAGNVALTTIIGLVAVTLVCAIQTSLYVELRDWKDGPATDTLDTIFA